MTAKAVRRKVESRELAALRAWLRLLACTNLIERRIRGQLRRQFATTLPRFDVLAELEAADRELGRALTMSELSRRLMVTNGNLTGLTERLVRERLVNRKVPPSDRRTQYVRLTRAGKRTLNAMVPDHRRWVSEMFDGLTDQDLSDLYELMGKLKHSLLSVPEEDRE